jgi:hypothetical protein
MPTSAYSNTPQSGFATRIAVHYEVISTPHPDYGPMPPPVPRAGPITHRGGARMRRRDRLALRMLALLQMPSPSTGEEVHCA